MLHKKHWKLFYRLKMLSGGIPCFEFPAKLIDSKRLSILSSKMLISARGVVRVGQRMGE